MGQVTSTCCGRSPTSGDDGPISDLPDECLASIFQCLSSATDRNRCSLVCRRWHQIEGQSRRGLTLEAKQNLLLAIPSLLSRFDSISVLALKNQVYSTSERRRPASIRDEALVLVSQLCPNLTSLELRGCYEVTVAGIESFAKNCKQLKKFSCAYCGFRSNGINTLLYSCPTLEQLYVECLGRGEPIRAGFVALSLKSICLTQLCFNVQPFFPLIIAAKNLRRLELIGCTGDWDKLFNLMADQGTCTVVEIHLEVEKFATAEDNVSDVGLKAISNCCSSLEVLHLVGALKCSDAGLVSIANRCKLLRKLYIDGWNRDADKMCGEGLVAVAECCPCLQELVLIDVNPTRTGLEVLASGCQNLELLALCESSKVGDAEISCIAAKSMALKELRICQCPVSDLGMQALAGGCPNLVKVKVDKCEGITSKGADILRLSRASLVVDSDAGDDGTLSIPPPKL